MKKKIILPLFSILFLLAGTLLVMGSTMKNKPLLYIGIALAIVFITLLFVFLISLTQRTKTYFKKFNDFYDNGLYEDGLTYFNEKLEKTTNLSLQIQIKYYLLTFHLLLDHLELAKQLLRNTSWATYSGYVLYFDILLDLYEGNLEQAYEKNESFQNYQQKNLAERKGIIANIISYVKDEIDTITIDSPYPIVLNVIQKYS